MRALIKRIISLILVVSISIPAVQVQAREIYTSEDEGIENDGVSLVPELTLSTLGDQLLVNYMGEVSPVRLIAGAYESSGRAVAYETAMVEKNKQARFTYDRAYTYKVFALEPKTFKPVCDASMETLLAEGEAELPLLDDTVAESMASAVSAYMEASARFDEVMALDIRGFRSDPGKLKAASAKLTEATLAYEKLMKAGATLSRVAETAAKKEEVTLSALSAVAEPYAEDLERVGATQDEQLHWAQELTKTYDSIQGNMKCKALGEMMGCDARRAYQQLCLAQNILQGHYYDEEAEATDVFIKKLTAVKGACKVGLFVGGTILTMGASAAASGAAYGTVTVGEAVGIVIGGVDTTVEVMNDTAVILSGRDKRIEEVLEKKSKPISEVCFVYSILTGGGGSAGEKIACMGDIYQHYTAFGGNDFAGNMIENIILNGTPFGKVTSTAVPKDAIDAMIQNGTLTESEREALKKQETESFTDSRPVDDEKLTGLLEKGGDLKEGESLRTVTDEFKDVVGEKVAKEDGGCYVHRTENGKDHIYTYGKDGPITGLYQIYDHETGALLEEKYYDSDGTYMGTRAKNGVIPYYDEEGRLEKEEIWEDDRLYRIRYYDEKTRLIRDSEYDGDGYLTGEHRWGYSGDRLFSEDELTDEYVGEYRVNSHKEYNSSEGFVTSQTYSLYYEHPRYGWTWGQKNYYGHPWYYYYNDTGTVERILTGEGERCLKTEGYKRNGDLSDVSEYITWNETERISKSTSYFSSGATHKIQYHRQERDLSGKYSGEAWLDSTEWYAVSWQEFDEEGNLVEEIIGINDFWTEKNGYNKDGILSYYGTHDSTDGSMTLEYYITSNFENLPFDPTGEVRSRYKYSADMEVLEHEEWDAATWDEIETYIDPDGKEQENKWLVWGYHHYDLVNNIKDNIELGRRLKENSEPVITGMTSVTVPLKTAAAAPSTHGTFVMLSGGPVTPVGPDRESDLPTLSADEKGRYTFELTSGRAGKRYVVMVLKGKLSAFPSEEKELTDRLLYVDQKTAKGLADYFTLYPKTGYGATVFVAGEGMSAPVPAAYLAENNNTGYDPADDEGEMPYECEPGDNPYENTEVKYPYGIWMAGNIDMVYTGRPVTINPRVYFRSKRLIEGTDYTIEYKRNVNAYSLKDGDKGYDKNLSPIATVKLKGDYTGEGDMPFVISPRSIAGDDFSAEPVFIAYTGEAQKPVPALMWNGKALKYGTDYSVAEYEGDGFKGTESALAVYKLTLTGRGNFKGTREVSLTAAGKTRNPENPLPIELMDKVTVSKIPDQDYTGSPITLSNMKDGKGNAFVPSVTYNGKSLEYGSDFSATVTDNTSAGTATLILTGLSAVSTQCGASFVGVKKVTFNINGTPIGKAGVEGIPKAGYIYAGGPVKPDVLSALTVTCAKSKTETATLIKNRDYTVSYAENDRAGTATMILTGIGGYTGTKKLSFKILPASLRDVDRFKVGLDKLQPYVKGGTKPQVTVTDKLSNKLLKEGTDYTLSYRNTAKLYTSADEEAGKKGQPEVIIKGKGNYKESVSETYVISPRSLKSNVILFAGDISYTGKGGIGKAPLLVTDRVSGLSLKAGTDYEKNVVYTYRNSTKVTQKTKTGKTEVLRGADEAVDKADIIPVGTVIDASVSGKGCFTGTASASFLVVDPGKDISKAVLDIADQEYAARAVTVSYMSQFKKDKKGVTRAYLKKGKEIIPLTLGTDFRVVPGSYVNNLKTGTAKVTFCGMGDYGGTKTVSFKIVKRKMYWQGAIR